MSSRATAAAALALLALPGAAARAQWSADQIKLIADQQSGAEARSQYFYHYFKKDRDPNLTPPQWVDETLDAMARRQVWQDPEEGILNEAQLWQAPAAVLYEFFQHTRKTFPPEHGGVFAPPGTLIKDYEDARTRFQMALDRLYRARLGDSLGGRGRAVIASFDLVLKQMDSLLDALSSQNAKRYQTCVVAIAGLTNNAFQILHNAPRGYAPPVKGVDQDAARLMLKLVGVLLIFGALWTLGSMNAERMTKVTDDYLKRSKEWALEFNRQFVQVKVQYLVFVPAGVGALLGLMTFDVFGFLILTGAGAYVGLNTPTWVLQFVRQRRGKRVEAQLMDAMILLSNSLKSGLDIVQGFELVARDLVPPISEEFGLVIKNYQLGTTFERSLEGMEERIASRLLSYVIKAIVIQRTVGGNLTKVFDRIVENIRDEGKLEEKMQALTAQQRIQSLVVGFMPWAMVVMMSLFQPETMAKYYFSPLGVMTVLFCAFWMSIGMGIVRKLANIQV
ncbi:MAG: type II secretion system F family protein [Elusimicrobia bacterium]|nr:type II secretion system F family protein [Elusimicrobiota bacterium]